MKFQCAFLYVAPNCDPQTQRAVIEGTDIDMNVIGCSTYAEAEIAAKELVAKYGLDGTGIYEKVKKFVK